MRIVESRHSDYIRTTQLMFKPTASDTEPIRVYYYDVVLQQR